MHRLPVATEAICCLGRATRSGRHGVTPSRITSSLTTRNAGEGRPRTIALQETSGCSQPHRRSISDHRDFPKDPARSYRPWNHRSDQPNDTDGIILSGTQQFKITKSGKSNPNIVTPPLTTTAALFKTNREVYSLAFSDQSQCFFYPDDGNFPLLDFWTFTWMTSPPLHPINHHEQSHRKVCRTAPSELSRASSMDFAISNRM
ncbi:hypothetical protein TNCV_144521 [Trichonephila clavipes]|nr:hypothetical protein TNCV_144521 [Trichonephila clavipes]